MLLNEIIWSSALTCRQHHCGLTVPHDWWHLKVKVKKEADLYSAFIEVPYTQGAQVRITQCYVQITQYLPLPHKHSPDGASQTEVADIYYSSLLLIYLPPKGWKAELAWVAGYVMRQFTCPEAVTHPSTNRATAFIETNALPLHQTANPNNFFQVLTRTRSYKQQ